jgi:hypothetical protein
VTYTNGIGRVTVPRNGLAATAWCIYIRPMTENFMLRILNEIRSDLAAVNDSWNILAFRSQVAAEIRAFRPPEPYNGKGVKYSDERIFRKKG